MASTPDPVCRFQQPASVVDYQSWFDSDGRLVKEAVIRKWLFEVKLTGRVSFFWGGGGGGGARGAFVQLWCFCTTESSGVVDSGVNEGRTASFGVRTTLGR